MLTHDEMIRLQADQHFLISERKNKTKEVHVLHLLHIAPYLQVAHLADEKRVLDLGCNTGFGSNILMDKASKVIGVDVSEKSIQAAKQQYEHRGIGFQLIDGNCLPFGDESFEIVVSFQVIEHIVDYAKYIGEIKRVLAPDGLALFTTPNANLRLDPGMKPWNKFHVREFKSIELKALVREYFMEAIILGQFAEEPLYSIELNRVNRSRNFARVNLQGRSALLKYYLRLIAKKLLSVVIPHRNRSQEANAAGHAESSSGRQTLDPEFLKNYNTENIYFQETEFSRALNLLAICGDSAENVAVAGRTISGSRSSL